MNIPPAMKVTDFSGPGGGAPALERDADRVAVVGLRVFLAVVTSLFFLFTTAYVLRSQIADWQPLSDQWQPLFDQSQLWVNTAFLVLGSLALQWAKVAARRGDAAHTLIGFSLGGLFALAFLGGQLWLWTQMRSWGYGVAGNPANSFFYLLTGLHGLHLLGGVVAWSRTARALWCGRTPPNLPVRIGLCATYWHYLLGLWLFLFALLVSTPETYKAIAAFCGISL
ncbi:cytochrome C oxidase subunit III [Exilibacterium tricleocarpae]|uniref:Cytochrome C oxidase subunit III n=1 Tax=Exilibacterium tricleocarpae TaxID=2591008 RepID=A0A545UBH1_9GAMM|nr:cytochrome c oxidase subunit 3 [Exilibacterium tricleocarpae]TQV86773.1 cytochrome C oxidase subunit III [Exilibacterium tricleocarpae]